MDGTSRSDNNGGGAPQLTSAHLDDATQAILADACGPGGVYYGQDLGQNTRGSGDPLLRLSSAPGVHAAAAAAAAARIEIPDHADQQQLHPMGRYLSSLGLYQRRHSTCVPSHHPLPPLPDAPQQAYDATGMTSAALAAIAAAGLADHASTTLGTPVGTTYTAPALFVSTHDDTNDRTLFMPMNAGAPPGMGTPRPPMSQQEQYQSHMAAAAHLAFGSRADSIVDHLAEPPGGGNATQSLLQGNGRRFSAAVSMVCADTPERSSRTTSPRPAGSDAGSDTVITMVELVERGSLVPLKQSPDYMEIPSELLAVGRSSITVGAAVGADKRRFNLKWLYDYAWLRFDPHANAMFCALCKRGKRANQFAKRGSRNFKTSAIVDHSSSNDHRRSAAQFSETSRGSKLVLVLRQGTWSAVTNPFEPLASAPDADNTTSPMVGARTDHPPPFKHDPALLDAAPAHLPEDTAPVPPGHHVQAINIGTQSTSDTYTTIASQSEAREDHSVPVSQQPSLPQPSLLQRAAQGSASRSKSTQICGTPGSSATPAAGPGPDERYASEFESAVQALFQAMELNLPISAVASLYRLKVAPTPLADIGSVGYPHRARSGKPADGLRLAGAVTTDMTVSARLLQHVVSSEILSLVKDEVSQSPAFSVVIDEAPLHEHNSLVAHALLYLRYMRQDPQSEAGGPQVVTRFWRCVHLYHQVDGRLARRDPSSMVLGLLERAKIQTSRLVCIACERLTDHAAQADQWRRRPHIIHWRGLFTFPNSLSPQVYEEISGQSDDFVGFAMVLSDLCLFVYSHPSSFTFLGVDFLEMLFKTLYEIFLSEGTLSTRLPISLTPNIVIGITRNISQIMATVLALSKLPRDSGRAVARQTSTPLSAVTQSSGEHSATHSSPLLSRPPLQMPLALVDAMSLPSARRGCRETVGRCPPADVLFQQLRDYSFLGCLHFMADILFQVEPVIVGAGGGDAPTQVFGETTADLKDGSLHGRLRKCLAEVKDAIESVTLMYGDEDDGSQDNSGHDGGIGGGGDEGFSGVHLNEFLHLTGMSDTECTFRSFRVENFSHEDSVPRLVELIRTVSSAVLKDLNLRFNAADLATIQALADMWNPAHFPRDTSESAVFANDQAAAVAQKFAQVRQGDASPSGVNGGQKQQHQFQMQTAPFSRTQSNGPLVDSAATAEEWRLFKHEAQQQLSTRLGAAPGGHMVENVQSVYRQLLFPGRRLAPTRRKLRTVRDDPPPQGSGWATQYPNLARLATAWYVLPFVLTIDLHEFRRHYEQQLHRICRDQTDIKLRPAGFDTDDTFTEMLRRLSPRQSKGKVSVYTLLQNSRLEVADSVDSPADRPGDSDLVGAAGEHFLRILDSVTLSLDHRLRLLSIRYTKTPLAVPHAPGECPKWMQNAMRGYWKLACRPPEAGSMVRHSTVPLAQRLVPPMTQRSSGSSAGGGTRHGADGSAVHGLHLDIGATTLGALGQRVYTAPATSPLLLSPPRLPLSLSAGARQAPAAGASHLALSASLAAGQPVSAVEDYTTIPLLEALLSDSTGAQQYPAGASVGRQASAAQHPHHAVALSTPPAKRPRYMDTANRAGLGLNHLGDTFAQQQQQQQQQQPGSMGPGDYFLGSDIARLASDMGLDAASSQALAASLSNQSTRAMPAPAAVGEPLGMGMANIPPQQQQHHSRGLAHDVHAFAAAFGGPPMMSTAPPVFTMPHIGPTHPMDPRMVDFHQHPFPEMAPTNVASNAPSAHAPPGYAHHHYQGLPDTSEHQDPHSMA